jgi:hypothetical protein
MDPYSDDSDDYDLSDDEPSRGDVAASAATPKRVTGAKHLEALRQTLQLDDFSAKSGRKRERKRRQRERKRLQKSQQAGAEG